MPEPEIFISYRRDDARGWPPLVQSALEQVFGHGRVFLDTRDIPAGATFPDELRAALARSKVTLVLIGPDWNPERGDHRRLDEDNDWVRQEVDAALHHCPSIIPVLVHGARMPESEELPPLLQPLRQHEAAEVHPSHCIDDVDRLIRRIGELGAMPVHAGADIGLLGLIRLARLHPATVEALGASRVRMEASCAQIDRLVARKAVHDQLHRIEAECLRPLEETPQAQARTLAGYRSTLLEVQREIARHKTASELADLIDSMLSDRMPPALAALQAAHEQPGRATRKEAIAGVQAVLSGNLHEVDRAIADSARHVDLDRLAEELQRILDSLPREGYQADHARITLSIERLRQVGQELRWRVEEHGLLQRLDTELRTLRSGRLKRPPAPEVAPRGWPLVQGCIDRLNSSADEAMKLLRAGLASGRCVHLLAAQTSLEALRQQMLDPQYPLPELQRALQATFSEVSRAFRAADTELKDWCVRMSELRGELSMVLKFIGA